MNDKSSWIESEDQWFTYSWEIRKDKIVQCQEDRKDQCYDEYPMSFEDFISRYSDKKEEPFPEMISTVRRLLEKYAGGR